MKKRLLTICVLIILLITFHEKLITKVYAQVNTISKWFLDNTSIVNNFNVANIDVEIREDFKPPSNWDGSVNDKLVKIQNNSTGPALIRVSIQKRWENNDGTSWAGNTDFINLNFSNNKNNLWIDGKDGYFYYNKILEKAELTDPLLDSVNLNIPGELSNLYKGKRVTVDVDVEAVQATIEAYNSTWKGLSNDIKTILNNLCDNSFDNNDYDYSNPIYTNGIDDTFIYDSTDSIVITKKNIKRKLPKVTGMYDISKYPIPLKNIVPDKETFELIKLENKQIMDNVEKNIENGTLTKHKAADGQFFGSISDDALGVEKKVYINTNAKGSHSLASYVPAGEVATIKLNDEALQYAKKGKLKISVGMTMVNAEDYNYNNNNQNRMPYLGKTFSVNESETKVGTPFGGMIYIDIDDSVPSGLRFEVDVKGVVDTPYYDLGRTTDEEWKKSKNAPGLFAEIRTPYLRFMVPSKFIRNINNPYNAALFWTNTAALSSNVMEQQYRVKPMSLVFDQYITAGIAYASVGAWICNLPPDWATSALDYDNIMKSGEWGTIHEINHHFQKRYNNYSDEWGVGNEFSEITNNALSSVSYILYTNIAAYRGEEGTYDWNKVADPYSSLKQQIYEGKQYYPNKPNIGNFMYSTFAHEIGPINFINVIKSTYDGGTFNGVYIPPYDYKLESDGEKSRNDRYDDLAYRLCVASERDYTWYIQNELLWPIKQETINKIKSHKYKETIPVQSVYSIGELGRETGRPFFIPSTGYVFDFEKSLISPGKVTVLDVSTPKYGTLTKLPDGKYEYKLNSSIPKNTKDEFILTVKVEADGIINETKLNLPKLHEYPI